MISTALSDASVYTNFSGLNQLKGEARVHSPAALKAACQQFEALFMQMMLKSMREATPQNGPFDSQQTKFFQGMADQQLALKLSQGQGIGLAQMLAKQLQRTLPGYADATKTTAAPGSYAVPPRSAIAPEGSTAGTAPTGTGTATASASAGSDAGATAGFESPADFVRKLWPQAVEAARKLGTDPRALIAQAALETGWGQAVIAGRDGKSSHNLFNIKADGRWGGPSVAKTTVEYSGGVAKKEVASFRAYNSFSDSFKDYVHFLKSRPRYSHALSVAGNPQAFVNALQQAGYATDPKYAQKISHILHSEPMVDTLASLKNPSMGTLS